MAAQAPQPVGQAPRQKHPLDVLQSMLNGVLIETGKALKGSNKDGSKAQVGITSRPIQGTIPAAVATFQQALDELEIDIIRSKSVLLRDLEELRSKRIALENPTPIVEPVADNSIPTIGTLAPKSQFQTQPSAQPSAQHSIQPSKSPIIKKDPLTKSPQKPHTSIKPPQPTEAPKEPTSKASGPAKTKQTPSPPASAPTNNTQVDSKPVGLGIQTESQPDPNAPSTAGPNDSAIDSLFDFSDKDENNVDISNFGNPVSFFGPDTQNPDQSLTQNSTFDRSTFGSNSQDVAIATSNANPNSNAVSNSNPTPAAPGGNENAVDDKQIDDLLDIGDLGDNDAMDLDLNLDMFGAEDSVFDDMFVDGGGMSGGGSDGNYDNAYFSLD